MNKKIADNYSEDDIVMVYDFAVPESWDDVINYLAGKNMNFREGIEDFLINDFIILRERGIPFEKDPHKVYGLINKQNND